MVQVNSEETNPEGKPGTWFTKDCDIIALIENVEDFSATADPRVEVKFRAETSTVPDQVGKDRTERLNLTGKAASKFLELACAVGCYTKGQWKQDVENKVNPDINEQDFVGRFCAFRITMKPAKNPKEGKAGLLFPNIDFNIWAIGDPEADHIPLTQEIIDSFPNGLPTKTGALRKRGDKSASEKSEPKPQPKSKTPPPAEDGELF